VRALANQVDVVLVVGARNSSNSNRLQEVAASQNKPAYLVQDENDIDMQWLRGARSVGISSGASTPEVLVQRVIAHLSQHHAPAVVSLPGVQEAVLFRLPAELA
jgi:4-hydroxy-3-methylbut-2-enyl diphosphate reductase